MRSWMTLVVWLLCSCLASAQTTADLEQLLQASLDQQGLQIAIELERDTDGRRTRLAYGPVTSNPSWRYITSSSAKPIQIAVILDLVARGVGGLTLQTRVADVWPCWAQTATGAQLDTRLWHLLSFSSGIITDPAPEVWRTPVWSTYVDNVCANALANNPTIVPGSRHTYQTTHLDVATVVAVLTSGAADWRQLFIEWTQRTGLFPNPTWVSSNPGTITFAASREFDTTTGQYLDFLDAVLHRQLLPAELHWQYLSDWIPAVTAPERVAQLCSQYGAPIEDWRFLFGLWRESRFAEPEPLTTRVSSVGRAGQYAVIDLEHGYRLVVSRYPTGQIADDALTGVLFARSIEPLLEQWSGLTQ